MPHMALPLSRCFHYVRVSDPAAARHVYALDMFRLYAALSRPGAAYLDKLGRMTEYLHAVGGPSRRLPLLGDDDGGRLFHPYGRRDEFGRSSPALTWLAPEAHPQPPANAGHDSSPTPG